MTFQDDWIAYNHRNPVLWGMQVSSILIEIFLNIFCKLFCISDGLYQTKSAVFWIDACIKKVCSSINDLYGL